jgi:Septum formation
VASTVRTLRVVAVRFAAAAAAMALAAVLAGCTFFGGHKSVSVSVSVFHIQPGQCFLTPAVKAELSSLTRTPCDQPHTLELYAKPTYTDAAAGVSSTSNTAFPGDDVLNTFAQGSCAQLFTAYVGVNYLDSKLFFTPLLPSPRSWESDDDRTILCFITTTGAKLTASVKGTKQ